MRQELTTARKRKPAAISKYFRFRVLLPAVVLCGAFFSVQRIESAPSGWQPAAETPAQPAGTSEPSEPQEPAREGFDATVVLPADFRRQVVEAVHRILFQSGEDPEDFAVEIAEDPVLLAPHTKLHRSLRQSGSAALQQPARLAGVVLIHRNGSTFLPRHDPMGWQTRMYEVRLESEDGRIRKTVQSDFYGTFGFDDLEAGRYRIILRESGFKTAVITVRLAPGQRRTIEAVLEEGDPDEVFRSDAKTLRSPTSDLLLRFVDRMGNWVSHVHPELVPLQTDERGEVKPEGPQGEGLERWKPANPHHGTSRFVIYWGLRPGAYRLKINTKGFKPAFADMDLKRGETRFLELGLKRGSTGEPIEIEARDALPPAKTYLAADARYHFSSQIRESLPPPLAYVRAVACGRFDACRPVLVFWNGTAMAGSFGTEFERGELQRVHRELEPVYEMLADISKGPERFYALLDDAFIQGVMETFRNSDLDNDESVFGELARRPPSLVREMFAMWLSWVTLDQWQRFELGTRFEGPPDEQLKGLRDPQAWVAVWRAAIEGKKAEFERLGHFDPDHLRLVSPYFKKFLRQGVVMKQLNQHSGMRERKEFSFLPASSILYRIIVGKWQLYFTRGANGLRLVFFLGD